MIHWAWLFMASGITALLMAAFNLSGQDSATDRRREQCEACQERMSASMTDHGNQRYLQGVADQGGPPVDAVRAKYLDDAPVLTAEQYGAMLDEEEEAG